MAWAVRFANLILMGAASILFLASLHTGYSYVWTHSKHFTHPQAILLYVGAPAAAGIVLFLCLRLQPLRKLKFVLSLASSVFAIYGAEYFLARIATHLDSLTAERVERARTLGVRFDSRSRIEVIEEFEKRKVAAVPAVTPFLLLNRAPGGELRSAVGHQETELLPLGGISQRPTVFCNELGEYVVYKSDEHGFNNPLSIWSSDRLDVAIVGDSNAHGACVEPERSFVGLIRNQITKTLTLGGNGNGPLLMLASLREYLPRLSPKYVLWFHCEGNDLGDLIREKNSPLLIRYLRTEFTQGLRGRQDAIDRVLQDFVDRERRAVKGGLSLSETLKLTRLRQSMGLVYGSARNAPAPIQPNPGDFDLFREILLRADRTASSWKGKLMFVYLPAWDRYNSHDAQSTKDREKVLNIVRQLQIPIIDIHEAFQNSKDPLAFFPFRYNGHYNHAGQELVANRVLESINAGAAF